MLISLWPAHCWSFPRLQQQWQVFLLPLVPCKERQTIVLFYRFYDPPAIFFACCWLRFRRTCHVVRLWTNQRVRNFRCFSNIQVRSRHERSRTWPVWFLMAKKHLLALVHVKIFSSLMWPVFFPRNGLENNSKLKSFYVRKRWGLGKCSLNDNCFSQDDPDWSSQLLNKLKLCLLN